MSAHPPHPPGLLGRRLRRWRRLNDVKQTDAADRLGLSQTTVSRIEAGLAEPDTPLRRRIEGLVAACPPSAADRALAERVSTSASPVHLVCDLTHRLLAASPARLAEWRLGLAELEGRSLWPHASPGIRTAEASLGPRGWHDTPDAQMVFRCPAHDGPVVRIAAGRIAWTRLPLSDGTFARLVRHLPSPA
jgi:transcriptional regulator with XRE-family HTH domain